MLRKPVYEALKRACGNWIFQWIELFLSESGIDQDGVAEHDSLHEQGIKKAAKQVGTNPSYMSPTRQPFLAGKYMDN